MKQCVPNSNRHHRNHRSSLAGETSFLSDALQRDSDGTMWIVLCTVSGLHSCLPQFCFCLFGFWCVFGRQLSVGSRHRPVRVQESGLFCFCWDPRALRPWWGKWTVDGLLANTKVEEVVLEGTRLWGIVIGEWIETVELRAFIDQSI